MKRQRHLSFGQILACCGILAAFALVTCLLFSHSHKKEGFREFCQELFEEEMTANTIGLHYSLAHPEDFGITDYMACLPGYEPGSETATDATLSETLDTLRSLDRKALSYQDRYACDLLERTLVLSLEQKNFPYYEEPLSPTQGMQCQLPILLSEYTFRSQRDVEDYLDILEETSGYFASLLVYEQEKAQAGTLMSAYSLSLSAQQCDTIVTLDQLEEGTHFLQTGFQERLLALSATVPLTSAQIQDYITQNNALLTKVLLPAYRELGAGLRKLETGAPQVTRGLASLPLGREYYALLLASETGSSRTPQEVRDLLQTALAEEYDTICQLTSDYPGCLPGLESGSYLDLGLPDADAMLEDLKKRISWDFPSLPGDGGDPSYPSATIKTVSPSLQDYCAPAYYLTAPIDKTDTNVIYINQKTPIQGLELYTTLAHEGYPGHLYQNAYMASHFLSMENNRLRQLLTYGGYLEGWALYVEQYSYDYASRLLASQGRAGDAVCVQIEKHNRSLQLGLYSLLDIMIHYEGAQLGDVYDFMEHFGITDHNTVSMIYTYICQSPCNYLKYYLGYLELLELKQAARELWEENYSDPAFHRFFLEWGPGDFQGLREVLKHYRPHCG